MKILTESALPEPGSPVTCLAIGVFDGVHLGHQAVIRRTIEEARACGGQAVAVTFDPHPQSVLTPDRAPLLLCPVWRKLEALADTGLDAALVFRFDPAFGQQPPEAFVERLRASFPGLASISVGAGFRFGHGRAGDLRALHRLGESRGFSVWGIPPVEVGGEVVSSSRLRELFAAGELDRVALLLGRRHALTGEVEAGNRLGRQLGFPTANLGVGGLVLPPPGVYAAFALGAGHGIRYPAAVNLGRRPTVDGPGAEFRVEAHLLSFSGDLYGRRIELELHERLRDEARFPSREALVEQIRRDVETVRARLIHLD